MASLVDALARLDHHIERHRQALNIPAVALAVTDRQQLLHLACYGYADAASGQPLTPETLFQIGSVGKSFTAILVLQQHAAGRVDLHMPVSTYLPWFSVQAEHAPITVHHLLSHTAGIISGTDFAPSSPYEVWALRHTETGGPPGDRYHYSNVGYKALSCMLEELTGVPYGRLLCTNILTPLEMHASAPVITNDIRDRLATGYVHAFDDRPSIPPHRLAPAPWQEYGLGDGSVAATPADMAKYVRMLLNQGVGPTGPVLTADGFNLLTRPAIDRGDGTSYAYGLVTTRIDGETVISHTGATPGFRSSLIANLEEGIGLIILATGVRIPPDIAPVAMQLLRAARHNVALPDASLASPELPRCADLSDFAGTYRSHDRTIDLRVAGDQLLMSYRDQLIPLQRHSDGSFLVAHPEFALYPVTFGREGDSVVEAFHGPDWYIGQRYNGPTSFDYPSAWDAFPGLYRAHNPWDTNFRVVLRKGALRLMYPLGGDDLLVPLGADSFRIGDDPASPERLSFDTVVGGQALQACLSGSPYFRAFAR